MKKYNREKEEAARLKISVRTLREWKGTIVPFHKVGRLVLFDPEAVDRALQKFERKIA